MEANLWKKLGLMIQLHDDFRLSIFCVISYLYFVLYCKSCKKSNVEKCFYELAFRP